ncbi:hypothetical protein MBH78_06765 [Oceanimonas sp. NS1]|nr:hypothetical protein [Oceanimonas sp. NS1]
MFGGFRLASRAWQTVDEHNNVLSETVQAQRLLRRLLARSEARSVPETRETALLSFQETSIRFSFSRPCPSGIAASASRPGSTWRWTIRSQSSPG